MSVTEDPSVFYKLLHDYKKQSNLLLNNFFIDIEDRNNFFNGTTINDISNNANVDVSYNCSNRSVIGTCEDNDELQYIIFPNNIIREQLETNYNDLKTQINDLKAQIKEDEKKINNKIINIKNNEYFAHTLNSDYSEMYKYKYLRNWGIFLSIVGGVYFFNKIK